MSRFYGQVAGMGKTTASRMGGSDIRVSAQSYHGSLQTRLWYNDNDVLCVDLDHSDDSSFYGRTLFSGTMDELIEKLK